MSAPAPGSQRPLLEVRGLVTEFRHGRQTVRANAGVSLSLAPGRTLGIVGESGSGKSVLCRALLRLIPSPPGHIAAGEVWFDGRDLLALDEAAMRAVRGTAPRQAAMHVQHLGEGLPYGHQGIEGVERVLEDHGRPAP